MGKDNITNEITDTLRGIELTEEGKTPPKEIIFVTDEERAAILDEPVRLHILQVLRNGIDDKITTVRDEEDGTKHTIEREVRRDALSVVEIVKESVECCGSDVEISKNKVYHHLPKLEEGGYVVKYGTVVTGFNETEAKVYLSLESLKSASIKNIAKDSGLSASVVKETVENLLEREIIKEISGSRPTEYKLERKTRTTDYWRRTAKGFVLTKGEWVGGSGTLAKKVKPFVEKMLETFDLNVSKDKREELYELITKRTVMQAEWRTKIAELVKGDVADKMILEQYETLLDYYAMGSKEYVDTIMRIREILFPDEPTV